MHTQASAITHPIVKADSLRTARLVALAFAFVMLFTVGFANSTPLHNAAHDTRHTQAFPCH